MVRVLVLQNIGAEVTSLGELDRPAVIVAELRVHLRVRSAGRQHLVDGAVSAVGRWGVAEVDIVAALVNDIGGTGPCDGGGGQKGHRCKDCGDHCCDKSCD